jgi:hypothetical protein
LDLSPIDGRQASGVNLVAKGEQTPALGSGLMVEAQRRRLNTFELEMCRIFAMTIRMK